MSDKQDIDKIAAEAARKWYSRVSPAYTQRISKLTEHIKAACEKTAHSLLNQLGIPNVEIGGRLLELSERISLCAQSLQSRPKGEPWTKEWLLHTFGCSNVMAAYQSIAAAHNTAISADKKMILEARRLLNKWATRYAESEHAKKDRDESKILVDAIDSFLK